MKKMLARFVLGVFVTVSLGFVVAHAVPSVYARVRAQAVEFLSGASKRWVIQLDSSNNLDIYENITINGQAGSFSNTTGGFMPRSRTSAQLRLLTPSAAGEIVFNSTRNTLCVSTGTTIAAWIPIQSPDSTKIDCNL